VVIPHLPGAPTTVTKVQGDDAVGMTRRDPGGNGFADRSSCVSDLQSVDVNIAAFFADCLVNPELLRSIRTNQRSIVPGNFRQRLG